jgi:hypothetical protein
MIAFFLAFATRRIRPTRQGDPVTKTTATGTMGIDTEALTAQSRFECLVARFRPHAENTARQKSPPTPLDGLTSIKRVPIGIGAGVRSLEEIEHDRIVATLPGRHFSNAIGHIGNPEGHPRIIQTRAGKNCQRTATPFRDDRMEFRHGDFALRVKRIEDGAEREPHAQPSDQDPGPGAEARAGPNPQLFLGATRATIHQHATAHTDQKIRRVALPEFENTIRRIPAIQCLPALAQFRVSLVKGSLGSSAPLSGTWLGWLLEASSNPIFTG